MEGGRVGDTQVNVEGEEGGWNGDMEMKKEILPFSVSRTLSNERDFHVSTL